MLESRGVVALRPGSAQGDPEVAFPDDDAAERVRAAGRRRRPARAARSCRGLKNQLRKRQPDFSEKRYGFNTFLSFVKAARTRDLLAMDWDDAIGDYRLHVI